MALVTGFQDVHDSVLIKVADEQYGHIPIVAELLDRFTTLADNWSELNKQAMDAVKAKNDALNFNRNAMYVISRIYDTLKEKFDLVGFFTKEEMLCFGLVYDLFNRLETQNKMKGK